MSQHEIARMNPRHYQILDLHLGGNGPKEIAQALGITAQSVSLITKSALFQSEVARRRETVEKKSNDELVVGKAAAMSLLEKSSLQAAQVQVSLLSSADPKTQLGASNSILDRVFGSDKTMSKPSIVIDAATINILNIALAESRAAKSIEVGAMNE